MKELEAIIKKWRERAAYYDPHARHTDMSAAKEDAIGECADELESLLPALDHAFNSRLDGPTHAEAYQGGQNAMRSVMACGHPKACLSSYQPDMEGEAIADECNACEHEHLAVAAALWEAPHAYGCPTTIVYDSMNKKPVAPGKCNCWKSHVSAKALDAHDNALWAEAVRRIIEVAAKFDCDVRGTESSVVIAVQNFGVLMQRKLDAHDADSHR